MKYLTFVALTVLMCLGLTSCKPEASIREQGKANVTVIGAVEKGPFIVGSSVSINRLSDSGENTGFTIVTSTVDDLGSFEYTTFENDLLQISATGYFRNEITGELSSSVLTLRSIYKTGEEAEQYSYVNLLTHLSSSRILNLIRTQNLDYQVASQQAESEFLSSYQQIIPGIEDHSFTSASIYESAGSLGSAYLLAVSSIIYEAAIQRSNENGTNPDAELSLMVNELEADFASDGIFNDSALIELLYQSQTSINPDEIVSHVSKWITEFNGFEVPDLNLYIDSDLDGVANSLDADDDNDGIKDSLDGYPYTKNFNVLDLNLVTEEDSSIEIDLSANNPNGGDITFTLKAEPTNGQLLGSYPFFTYEPNLNYFGIDQFTYELTQDDVESGEVFVDLTISPVNDEPSISGNPLTSIKAGNEYSFVPTVVNIELDELMFSIANQPSWSSFDIQTGTLSGLPINDDAGLYSNIVISVSDGHVTTSLPSFAIDVVENPWEYQTGIPTRRHSPTVSQVEGNLYVVGGYSGSHLATMEMYDLTAGNWVSKPSLQIARSGHSASVIGSKIYVLGGNWTLDSMESYDIDSGVWSSEPSMITPRNSHDSCVHDGKIYVFGGRNDNTPVTTVEMYDPNTGTWSVKASNSKLHFGVSCVTVGDDIYVIGGDNNENGYEIYNTLTDTWTYSGSLNSTMQYGFSASLIDGKIYLIGGYNARTAVEVFDPNTESWIAKSSMPEGIHNMGSTNINGIVYIVGGRNSSSNSIDTFLQYDSNLDPS